MKPMDESHLAILRRHMAEVIDLHFDLAEDEIGRSAPGTALRQALLDVPRHLFVPSTLAMMAYQDTPLPIGFDKTLSQPFIGALMLDLLDLDSGEHLLEIGTGFGYQAALAATLGAKVSSVEIVEEFAAAARRVPTALIEQLNPGGRIVIPIGGKDVQQLSVVDLRLDGSLATRAVIPVRFTQLETQHP